MAEFNQPDWEEEADAAADAKINDLFRNTENANKKNNKLKKLKKVKDGWDAKKSATAEPAAKLAQKKVEKGVVENSDLPPKKKKRPNPQQNMQQNVQQNDAQQDELQPSLEDNPVADCDRMNLTLEDIITASLGGKTRGGAEETGPNHSRTAGPKAEDSSTVANKFLQKLKDKMRDSMKTMEAGEKGEQQQQQSKAEAATAPPKLCLQAKGKKEKQTISLRDKMMERLKSARFRYLNEQLYTTDGKHASELFNRDKSSFETYHEGFRQQVSKWPLNPLDKIISAISKMSQQLVVADFGCGDAKLAEAVPQKTVHSLDLVAANPGVVACDMASTPLEADSVDVAVFCLSLMGTNLHDYIYEANRVMKTGGTMKIAEVESRFDDVDSFIEGVERYGFKLLKKDLTHQLFYFLDFKKLSSVKNRKKLPTISLHPCFYKKR